MNVKMAEAVTLAKIAGAEAVNPALRDAALHGRFAHGDLASILNANIRRTTSHAANEASSLTQGSSAWAGLGAEPAAERSRTHEPRQHHEHHRPLHADLEALMRQLKIPPSPGP
jgi:hypothetical protein